MNIVKGRKSGHEEPIVDSQLIRACLDTLYAEGTEFPIKVEGTSTLPYASAVVALDWEKAQFVLRLVRPLPHELALGATFLMVFTVADQRYEGLTTFVGREAYLHYRFEVPKQFLHSDRRRHQRFPFRPRESAYIIAQSGSLAGLGVAGPLANISMGGLALRLDRLIRLEDKMRLPVHSGALDVGLVFDRIRLQDLPKLPLLELRGRVAHLSPRGDEVFLGLEFWEMGEEESRALQACLDFREKTSRGSCAAFRSGGNIPQGGGVSAIPGDLSSAYSEAPDETPELAETDSPLRLLQRRTTRLGLIMSPSESRDEVLALLNRHGYFRIEIVESLEQAQSLWAQETDFPRLILTGMISSHQRFQELLESQGGIPGVLLTDSRDPSLMMGLGGRMRVLPLRPESEEDEEHSIRILDGLAEIED